MTVKVTWYGGRVLGEIKGATPKALVEAAEQILDAATARAPRGRTGRLANSGYVTGGGHSTYRAAPWHRKERKPPKDGALVAFATFYAHFNEFGTRKQRAKPFLRPAFDELRRRLPIEIAKGIRKRLTP